MPPKKNRVKVSSLKGIKLYNFLLKQLGEENAKSSRKQVLGVSGRREIVSKILYPQFKDGKPSMTAIRKAIRSVIKGLPPKEICNPLYLSEAYLAQIEYYEIDNHIRNVLPDCVNVRVNAGYLGKTKIFNTRGYSYYSDGVRRIVESIRKELRDNKSGVAYFDGVVKLIHNKPNDGKAENYFIDYILFINDVPESDDIPVDFELSPKEKTKKIQVKSYLATRFGKLQKEKRRKKREIKKATPKTEKEKRKELTKEIRVAINAIKRLMKSGQITKEEFERQKENLMKLKKK